MLVLSHIFVVTKLKIYLPLAMCRSYDVRPATVVDIQHREAMVVTYCSLQNEGFFEIDFQRIENSTRSIYNTTPRNEENRLPACNNLIIFWLHAQIIRRVATPWYKQYGECIRGVYTPKKACITPKTGTLIRQAFKTPVKWLEKITLMKKNLSQKPVCHAY